MKMIRNLLLFVSFYPSLALSKVILPCINLVETSSSINLHHCATIPTFPITGALINNNNNNNQDCTSCDNTITATTTATEIFLSWCLHCEVNSRYKFLTVIRNDAYAAVVDLVSA